MLIAVSGSQGSGKSTTLKAIKEKGYNIIERKTSRSILDEWGVTLHQVNNNSDLTIKFQDEITKRKYDDEIAAVTSDDLWFTERTHADLFTYALVSLGKDNQHSDWLNEYYDKCKHFNENYARVCYLKAGHFSIEHDDVRGSNDHYSRMVDIVMLDFTKQMVHSNSLNIIDTPDLQMRLNSVFWSAASLTKNKIKTIGE